MGDIFIKVSPETTGIRGVLLEGKRRHLERRENMSLVDHQPTQRYAIHRLGNDCGYLTG